MKPAFSVVVPSRNRPAQVRQCLEGLAAQRSAPEFEVILVDDGSEPPYAGVAAAMPGGLELRLVRLPGQGLAAARNEGARVSRSPLLAFLDDDCVPAPEWLGRMAAALHESQESLVGGRTVNAVQGALCSQASQALLDYMYEHFNRDPLRPRLLIGSNLAMSRAAFEAVGGFDRSFPVAAGEDRDLCERWLASGRPLVWVREAVVHHHRAMGLLDFLRQHVRYGRGSRYFYLACRRRSVRAAPPGARFYAGLLAYPFRAGLRPPVALAALLLLSQLATLAGYACEAARSGPGHRGRRGRNSLLERGQDLAG